MWTALALILLKRLEQCSDAIGIRVNSHSHLSVSRKLAWRIRLWHYALMLRIRRWRAFTVFLLGLLVLSSVWHVSHVDFHTHTHADTDFTTEADAHPQSGDTEDSNSLSVHPTHVLAYLSLAPMLSPRKYFATVAGARSGVRHSRPPSGLFRPPRG